MSSEEFFVESSDGAQKACKFDPNPDGSIPTGDKVIYRIPGDEGGYLVQAVRFDGGGPSLDPGHYLLIPNRHVPQVDRVLGWSDVAATLLRAIPEFAGVMPDERYPFIRYELHGEEAGRTIADHAHEHVVIGPAAIAAALERLLAVVNGSRP